MTGSPGFSAVDACVVRSVDHALADALGALDARADADADAEALVVALADGIGEEGSPAHPAAYNNKST